MDGEARRLLGDSNLTEQHKMALEFFLNQYDLFEGWKMIQQMTAVNLQDCLLQCQGKYLLEDNNIKRVYFRSRLDKTIEYGLHPYWNNEALIYSNGKYFAVYEWGEDPVEVETQR